MVDPAMPDLKDAARQHVGITLGEAVDRVGNQPQRGALVSRHRRPLPFWVKDVKLSYSTFTSACWLLLGSPPPSVYPT
jgi:hypothetical protein